MEASTLRPKRKNIDLNPNTFRTLSIMAASKGTNLKHFIEDILDKVAEENKGKEPSATDKDNSSWTNFLDSISGAWKDDRDPDTMVAELRKSRYTADDDKLIDILNS